MSYKLFIDDLRMPTSDDWVIARSSHDAWKIVQELGAPSFISYDHDLGEEDTSMLFIHTMIRHKLDNPDFNFPVHYAIHSANPVGVKNIDGLLKSFIRTLE
jgi:hypothetical protein